MLMFMAVVSDSLFVMLTGTFFAVFFYISVHYSILYSRLRMSSDFIYMATIVNH